MDKQRKELLEKYGGGGVENLPDEIKENLLA